MRCLHAKLSMAVPAMGQRNSFIRSSEYLLRSKYLQLIGRSFTDRSDYGYIILLRYIEKNRRRMWVLLEQPFPTMTTGVNEEGPSRSSSSR